MCLYYYKLNGVLGADGGLMKVCVIGNGGREHALAWRFISLA